ELCELDVEIANRTDGLTEPCELGAKLRRLDGKDVLEQRDRRSEPSARDAHVVQVLDVVAEPRPGLVRDERGEVSAQNRERDLPDRVRGRDRGWAELLALRTPDSGGGQPGLVLAEHGRLQATCSVEAFDERRDRLDGRLGHLDLDASQTTQQPAVGIPNRGLVEEKLAARHIGARELEHAASRLQFEEGQQLTRADERTDALADRPTRP